MEPEREIYGRGEPQLSMSDQRALDILTEFAEAQGWSTRVEHHATGFQVVRELGPRPSARIGFHDQREMQQKTAMDKGRPKRKLTDEEVKSIRRSNEIVTALAKRFGVSRKTIYRIQSRKTYQHVR